MLFHSSEAIVGGSPYNRTEGELDGFLDRLDRVPGLRHPRARGAAGDVPRVPRALHGVTRAATDQRAVIAVRICHVTPHLPPDQAANALLPYHLGCWARDAGDEVSYVAHPPRAARPARGRRPAARPGGLDPADARQRRRASVLAHRHPRPLRCAICARGTARRSRPPTSCTCTATACWPRWRALLGERARQAGRDDAVRHRDLALPPKASGPDLFTRAYRRASHVTFYSHGLQTRAWSSAWRGTRPCVVYPAGRRRVRVPRRARADGSPRRPRACASVTCS